MLRTWLVLGSPRAKLVCTINSYQEIPLYCKVRTRLPLTCFAYPIHVSVELSLKLLLPPELEKSLSVLHALPLLGELAETRDVRFSFDSIQFGSVGGFAYPDKTPSTRLSMKKDPMTMRGTK